MAAAILRPLLTILAILPLASACYPPTAGSGHGSNQTHQSGAEQIETQANTDRQTQLLAAAEAFEALTEKAFDTQPGQREAALADAENAARTAGPLLSADDRNGFDTYLGAIQAAQAPLARVDMAIASNELFRMMVTAAAAGSTIPVEVSLLDYCGFRYSADLQGDPVRWADMSNAVAFADSNWAAVKSQIHQADSVRNFGSALQAMRNAVDSHDARAANRAAQIELDLVDVLESSFSGM